MERKNGYIILNNYKIIQEKSDWNLGSIYEWLFLNDSEYMFKMEKEKDALRELFWSYILEILKVNHVSYDLANYDGINGVISKTYNPDNKIITMSEIINAYIKHFNLPTNNLFNIQKLNCIFKWYFKNRNRKNLKNGTTLQFIMQVLCGNPDLHSRNFIIKNGKPPTIRPFFDYGDYGKIDWNNQSNTFQLKANPILTRDPRLILANFLCSATPDDILQFHYYFSQMQKINPYQVLEQMEEKIKRTLTNENKNDLARSLTKNLEQVEICLERKTIE